MVAVVRVGRNDAVVGGPLEPESPVVPRVAQQHDQGLGERVGRADDGVYERGADACGSVLAGGCPAGRVRAPHRCRRSSPGCRRRARRCRRRRARRRTARESTRRMRGVRRRGQLPAGCFPGSRAGRTRRRARLRSPLRRPAAPAARSRRMSSDDRTPRRRFRRAGHPPPKQRRSDSLHESSRRGNGRCRAAPGFVGIPANRRLRRGSEQPVRFHPRQHFGRRFLGRVAGRLQHQLGRQRRLVRVGHSVNSGISPARALAYSPFTSRFSHSSREVATWISTKLSIQARTSSRTERYGEIAAVTDTTPLRASTDATQPIRRMFVSRSAFENPSPSDRCSRTSSPSSSSTLRPRSRNDSTTMFAIVLFPAPDRPVNHRQQPGSSTAGQITGSAPNRRDVGHRRRDACTASGPENRRTLMRYW